MYEAFIDLDELIARCRDKQARQFIKEAVACYKAGAYRSCIVATWNAVVFDFLHKLRELKLLEDKEASHLLEQFEKLSLEKKVKELWQFESDIPKKSLKPFELISIVEMSDIERLFEDRSRCAHPSMTSLEEPFEATAELARYHLRSAVTHLLERPPVQGRAARDRIFQDIKSEYFPTDSELAIKYFQKSPLARARLSLIKDVIIGLTISLLTDNLPEDERARQFSAIQAISNIYPEKTREILNEKLSDIILSKVVDENWNKVIIYLGKIKTWDSLTEPCQIKGIAFIDKLKIFEKTWYSAVSNDALDLLLMANRIGFLRESVKSKLQLPLEQLISIKKSCQDKSQYNLINETIEPLLENAIPEATFDELISMRSENSDSLNTKIEPYLVEKIKEVSLESILDGFWQIRQEEKLLHNALEERLKFVLDNSSLEELIEVRQNYTRLLSRKKMIKITSLLDEYVVQLFEKETFDNLIYIKYKYNNDELFNTLLKPLLKDNISKIINLFKLSSSFANAASNANLLHETVDFITSTQWKEILDAFLQNSQISDSHSCVRTFETLFKKSINIDISVKTYWLSFREKLNHWGISDRYINSLKKLIDSTFPDE
ncbi:hypothetical protein CAL7716_079830 [Calothrix sp. PCC 7716]|nr:hypothetical protein CAL7716_079830 [Calothrix sp. PCC 7716]